MPSSKAIEILHYVCPTVVLLLLVVSQLVAQYKNENFKIQRYKRPMLLLRWLSVAVLLTYVCQAVVVTIHTVQRHNTAPDHVIYTIASILNWLWITSQNELPWHSFVGCAVATAVFDAALTGLNFKDQLKSANGVVGFAFQISQLAICVSMTVIGLTASFNAAKETDVAIEPLLPSPSPSHTGVIEEEDEEGNKNQWSKQFRERLKAESGSSSLEYVKAFKVFIPYLLPKNDRTVQFWMVIFASCLVAQRALNVLIPRQLGLVTDYLSQSVDGGSQEGAPIAALWIYLFLKYLPLGQLKYLAEIPLDQFAYKRIACAAFSHVMQLDITFFDDEPTSEIFMAMQQGTSIRTLLMMFVDILLPALADLIVAFWYLGHLFDFYISFPIFMAATCYVFSKTKLTAWTRMPRKEMLRKDREQADIKFEAIAGWRNVCFFNRIPYEKTRYEAAVDEANEFEKTFLQRSSLSNGICTIIIALAFGVVSTLVVTLIAQRQAPLGSFITLTTYWSGLWSPIEALSGSYQRVNNLVIDAERLLWLLSRRPNVVDRPNAKDLVVTHADVSFKQVNFEYDPRRPILQDVSFDARSGMTAFVGETGAGKSTLYKLLFRFYDVTGGSIQIDGQDIRDVTLSSLREAIGIVPQEPYMLDETIMKNLRYAQLDVSDDEIYEACRAAAIHDKILSFPDGYDSTVGERGVKLSGGELQRVAIARCLLKNPKIILLDEASSSVDSETEAHIQQALKKMNVGRTTIAIAHRLSTIVNADRILVLHDGKVVQSGTHNELVRQKDGRYYKLWSLQFKEPEDTEEAGELEQYSDVEG